MHMIDGDAAREAIELALPSIRRAMQNPAAGDSGCLHIVVMDPRRRPGEVAFEEAILYEYSINREAWDADYQRFARAKARISWRTGLDSQQVQTRRPHLLEAGDTLLWGSVCLAGIVVAVSGMQPWYDEALSGSIAWFLTAIVKDRAMRAAAAGPFLPGR